MSSLTSLLPEPRGNYQVLNDQAPSRIKPSSQPVVVIPPYGSRSRFIPKQIEDFGDGGSFPEIHVSQFPLDMGRQRDKPSNVLAVTVNKEGEVSYDAIAQQGHGKNKVYSSFTDIVEKRVSRTQLEKPPVEEEQETAERTRNALQGIISGKIASARPTNVPQHKTAAESSSYYRYTPNPNAPGYNPNASQRIIRMVEAQVDPLEPPKFKHKKAPRGPPSPPVPILHSPPRKVTVQDQQAWKIPARISNWKNIKGYTIPLDKRLAADGRGLQEVTINDKFATMTEALQIAERQAREEVRIRAQVQKKLSMKEKEAKEAELRELAARARMERAGITRPENDGSEEEWNETREDKISRQERDKIRHERKRERERELRLEKLGKHGKLGRDEDRDISEKIALGQLQGTGAGSKTGEAQYDARLFNQSQGISSGFGHDDEYNVYSKPLADRGAASSIYRPTKNAEFTYQDGDTELEKLKSTKRFKADNEFKGTESEAAKSRTGPVQFEKEESDPFGLDQFLSDARKGKTALENIGKVGHMRATG